jgi:outer membrane protein OmpA-like peptidoglycan-associated protein
MLTCATLAFAQDGMDQGATAAPQARTRAVATGEKAKMKGVIVDRDPGTFVIRDENDFETIILLTDQTSVKSNGGFFRRGKNYGVTNLLRGLQVEVEGRGNPQGQLVAEKVRFDRDDLKVARSIESRVDPVEGRLTEVEAQNRSLAGQVDELNEVSREIKGDVARANMAIGETNERISALDDYEVQDMTTVYFKVNSSKLSPEGMQDLDDLAMKISAMKGYVVEVAGFTDTTGSVEKNRALSEKRADSVVRYLQENHDIPLRRMITPYGYGETRFVADNDTQEGREQNRRVEVKILVNRGLTQQGPTTQVQSSL